MKLARPRKPNNWLDESWKQNCYNLGLGLATKARGCKVVSQEEDLGVTSHAPKSAKSVRESTFTFPSDLPW
jgi:hypothetical protein